jgi:hypothetical protein
MLLKEQRKAIFTSPVSRALAAIFGALIAAVMVTAGMPLYLPFSQTDNMGLPILLFPLVWFIFFLYSVMSRRVFHVLSLFLCISLLHALLIFISLG